MDTAQLKQFYWTGALARACHRGDLKRFQTALEQGGNPAGYHTFFQYTDHFRVLDGGAYNATYTYAALPLFFALTARKEQTEQNRMTLADWLYQRTPNTDHLVRCDHVLTRPHDPTPLPNILTGQTVHHRYWSFRNVVANAHVPIPTLKTRNLTWQRCRVGYFSITPRMLRHVQGWPNLPHLNFPDRTRT